MSQNLKNSLKKTKLNSKGNFIINNGTTSINEPEDRLSSLPDNLIADILSNLSVHAAAATSILSRRWRYVWTQVTHLHFDFLHFQLQHNSNVELNFSTFCTIVDHILRQLTTSKIHTFHLRYPVPEQLDHEFGSYYSYFAKWIPIICSRNPEEIQVTIQFHTNDILPLPVCVFQTRSLVHLELTGNFRSELPRDIDLPCLKILEVNYFDLDPDSMAKFIKSSPSLEVLSLRLEWTHNGVVMDISALNLKSLAVYMRGISESSKISINAPKLEHVVLHGFFAFYYFLNDQSALLSADLGFYPSFLGRNDYLTHLSVLLQTISSVSFIQLFDNLAVINPDNYADANLLKIFRNLTKIRLTRVSVDYVNWSAPIPAYLLTKVKWMELDELKGDHNDLKFLKYILSKAKGLEELFVNVSNFDDSEKNQVWRELIFCRELFKLPRRSVSCVIKFSGDYIESSSNDFESGSMACRIDWG